MEKLKAHWTERSIDDFVFKVAADFAQQIENYIEQSGENRAAFAKKLRKTPGRISQVLNAPGNLSLKKIVEYARAAGKKVAVVAYDDGDTENAKGLVNSQVFEGCWIRCGKPADMFSLQGSDVIRTFVIQPGAPIHMPVNGFTNAMANNRAQSLGPQKSTGTDADKPRISIEQLVVADNG